MGIQCVGKQSSYQSSIYTKEYTLVRTHAAMVRSPMQKIATGPPIRGHCKMCSSLMKDDTSHVAHLLHTDDAHPACSGGTSSKIDGGWPDYEAHKPCLKH